MLNSARAKMRAKCCKGAALMEKILISKEPVEQFKAWFEEACSRKEIIHPNVMCLATATKDGYPSARHVILKGYDKDGFKFYTNYQSRKAQDMDENPNVAATFFWEVLDKTVRIEGYVEKLSEEESAKFFHSQPVPSQITAYVSRQSTPIESNDVLKKRISIMQTEYVKTGKDIPKPCYWGGYVIQLKSMEFYQGQKNRMANRIKFRRPAVEEVIDGKILHEGKDGWVYENLSP